MNLGERIIGGYRIDFEEAVELAQSTPKSELYAIANTLRGHYHGARIEMCSIINARSGRCSEDCKWCAQSAFHNTDIDIYPLVGAAQVVNEACHNSSKGVHRFSLVTSGRSVSGGETDRVCAIYEEIGRRSNIKLCASLGLLDRDQMRKLRDSGVTRYHCNLETAPSFFSKLCTTHTVEQKLETIGWAREAGLEICSGGIIGMGESAVQRLEFAFALRDVGAVSIPLNVLNPIAGTPLELTPVLSDDEILTAFAMMRIVNPEADIRLAGGRSVFKHIEERALRAGVSSSIVGDMLTTAGSDIDSDKEMFARNGYSVE